MGNNDPHYLTTMEPDPTSRFLKRPREPFSDFTNSFNSLSSSSLPINPSQLKLLRFPSSSFIKTPAKPISTTNPSNPSSSPPSSLLPTPSLLPGSIDVEASEPISIRDSQRRVSTRIKDKEKAISNNRERSGGAEGASVPTTKALTVPSRKTQVTEEASHVQISVPTLGAPQHLQHINGNKHSHNPAAGHTPKRRPFTDCTNTAHSLNSSSMPIKPNTLPSSHNKTSAKRISSSTTSTTRNTPSNPSSPPSPLFSTPSLKSSSLQETSDVESSKSISIKYSRRRATNQRKNKGKTLAIPASSSPSLRISDTRKRSGRVEGVNLPKAKALTAPLTKKHRSVLSGQDMLKDPVLQDFIAKQNAYFKEIDEFKLSEEEVGSADELD